MKEDIYLLFGSNLGKREEHIQTAASQLEMRQVEFLDWSSKYYSSPWGITDQPDFLNRVARVRAAKSPEELLNEILQVEKEMGRKRDVKWGPRLIDIDILFYGNRIIDTNQLKVPHPEIHNRKFTLQPLTDIAGTMIHPVFQKTLRNLLDECTDEGQIWIEETSASR